MEYFTCDSQNMCFIEYLGFHSIPNKDKDKISTFLYFFQPSKRMLSVGSRIDTNLVP